MVFRIYYNYYKYQIILFGLTNTPIIYQEINHNIFKEFLDKFCIYYLNDILIYSNKEIKYKRYIK